MKPHQCTHTYYYYACSAFSYLTPAQGNLTTLTHGIRTDLEEANLTLAEIEARYSDMVQLENSIKELHDLFVDVAMLGDILVRSSVQMSRFCTWKGNGIDTTLG